MKNPKKLKICDYDGKKIDSVLVHSDKDAQAAFTKWKRKGLF